MKSMKPRALSLEKQVFELVPTNYEAFKSLSLWTKRKIKEAKECPKEWDPEATIDAKEDGDEIPF
jgi:hypothetical protein